MIRLQDQHRTVFILAVAQALANSCMSIFGTVSALAGKMLAADPRFATVPLGLQFILTLAAPPCSPNAIALLNARRCRASTIS